MTLHSRIWNDFCKTYEIRNVDTVTDITASGVLFALMKSGRVDGDEVHYEADFYDVEGEEPSHFSVALIPSRSLWTVVVDGVTFHDTLGEYLEEMKLSSDRRPSTGLYSPLSLVYFESFPETWGSYYRSREYQLDRVTAAYPRYIEVADQRFLRIISFKGGSMNRAEEVFEIVIDMNVPIVYYKCRHLQDCVSSFWKLRSLSILSK